MDNMFEELLQGWGKAFDEIGLLEEYRKKAVVVKYSKDECFTLEDYTPDRFPPGNELLDRIPDEIVLSYEEYGLTADGLPCYHRTVFENDSREYAGFYRYSPEVVEYIQYNVAERVVHWFHRMELEEGSKVAFLRAVSNGGGAYFKGMTGAKAIEEARHEAGSIFLVEYRYEYENGRIVRHVSHSRVAGRGEYSYVGRYAYDQDGQLLEIMDVYPDGREQLRYCYWDVSEGLDGLTERLVKEMAEAIVKVLLVEKLKTPIAILELSYHYADSYIPMLTPTSMEDKEAVVTEWEEGIWQGLFLSDDWLDARPRGMERTFTQFMQQVKNLDGHNRAREMLLKTAKLLTTSRLLGKMPVDEEFFAYAIDHTIEGHSTEDFKDILLNCGMNETQYDLWAQRGWMR
jgi:hypothetical protein